MKVIFCVGVLSTLGMVAAAIPVPGADELGQWPVTAMLAFITLTSLSILFFMMREVFTTMKEYAQRMGEGTEAIKELCARLNVRPCLRGKE